MYPERRNGLSTERPPKGLDGSATSEKTRPRVRDVPRAPLRAVISEPHPAVRAVLEYLLLREGYAVEPEGDPSPGPALLLVAAEDEGGLYVFESGDAAETLGGLVEGVPVGGGSSTGVLPGVIGVRAFVPEPFGVEDVLRVVRAVGGFDGRRRRRPGRRSEARPTGNPKGNGKGATEREDA